MICLLLNTVQVPSKVPERLRQALKEKEAKIAQELQNTGEFDVGRDENVQVSSRSNGTLVTSIGTDAALLSLCSVQMRLTVPEPDPDFDDEQDDAPRPAAQKTAASPASHSKIDWLKDLVSFANAASMASFSKSACEMCEDEAAGEPGKKVKLYTSKELWNHQCHNSYHSPSGRFERWFKASSEGETRGWTTVRATDH